MKPDTARPDARGRETGQAGSLSVEMALVLPIMVLLFCGIIEIANILRIQTTMQSAVTKIARFASTQETSQASAEQYMTTQGLVPMVKQNEGSQAPTLTLTPSTTASCRETPCTPFEVKLTYTYQAMTDPMKVFFDNLQLSASAKKMSEDWGQ